MNTISKMKSQLLWHVNLLSCKSCKSCKSCSYLVNPAPAWSFLFGGGENLSPGRKKTVFLRLSLTFLVEKGKIKEKPLISTEKRDREREI